LQIYCPRGLTETPQRGRGEEKNAKAEGKKGRAIAISLTFPLTLSSLFRRATTLKMSHSGWYAKEVKISAKTDETADRERREKERGRNRRWKGFPPHPSLIPPAPSLPYARPPSLSHSHPSLSFLSLLSLPLSLSCAHHTQQIFKAISLSEKLLTSSLLLFFLLPLSGCVRRAAAC
jgi:hypothetical protein